MKIGILTQPLGQNYGGLLQNYALQYFLCNYNQDIRTVDILHYPLKKRIRNKYWFICMVILSRLFHKFIKQEKINIFAHIITPKIERKIYNNLLEFKFHNIKSTSPIRAKYEINKVLDYNFDTYIVGSDQVWRPQYSPYQPHFFLDFVANRKNIKRIVYAASFGLDNNSEFSPRLLKICKPLAQKFDAISVREDFAVKQCKDLFNLQTVQVLDPTMLLDAEHYIKLAYKRDDFNNDGDLFTYILDESPHKQSIIDFVAEQLSLKPFKVLPKSKYEDVGLKQIEDCVLPSVEQWLRAFVDAKYVVTDSFHGCVFSILFERPFIAIANKSRGMARFISLLKLFGLEDRLVFKPEDVTEELIKKPIAYDRVYKILETEREKSKKFLLNALNIKK